MKRAVLPFFLGVLLLTLQTTLLMSLVNQRIRPDLVLILTLYLGLSYPPISGGILAFFLGYLMDLFSGNVLGLYTLSRPLIFYIAQIFKDRVYLEGFLSQFLFVFLSALVEGFLLLLLLNGLNPNPLGNLYPSLLTVLLPQSLSTGLMTPVLFSLFRKGSLFLSNPKGMGIRETG
jgi:rod shape-determining protein MreD